MAITLSDLRTFAREIAAADVSGSSSDREVNYWINSALRKLWSAHNWHWTAKEGRINMPPAESATTLILTKGSGALQLVAPDAFAAKYVTSYWDLLVDGEDRMAFRLASLTDAQNATMLSDQLWPNASDTGVTVTFVQSSYGLPDDCQRILRADYAQSDSPIRWRPPGVFDRIKQASPTQTGTQPLYYTVRAGRVEFFPANSSSYRTVIFTYLKSVPEYATSDDDSTEVDWPNDREDLLQAAILVRASMTQGENAMVPYGMAKLELDELLKQYKAEDSQIGGLAGPMDYGLPEDGGDYDFSYLDNSGLTSSQ